MKIELFLHKPRFDESPAFLCIDFENAIQVLRHVQNDSFANCLSCEARPRASGKDWYVEISRDLHCRKHIFVRSWNNHTDRFDFVNTGVGAVDEAGNFIEADLSRDPLLKGFVQIFVHALLHLAHARLGGTASAAARRRVCRISALRAGDGKNGQLLVYMAARAMRTIHLRIVPRNDLFKFLSATLTEIFE
jgi:hypothetical protein